MPLTDAQRNALPAVRTMLRAIPCPCGTAESLEQRTRRPAPETLPPDITVRVEIASPSPHTDSILESTGMLKTPELVPIYFYSLSDNRSAADSHLNSSLSEADAVANTRVIFFIHGGGNITGHPTFELFTPYYTQLLRAVASQSGRIGDCVLILPSYRLATVPENAFPAALQDVMTAYDYVLSKGYGESNIVIAGDSSGGNHAVVLTHLILQAGKPLPHGVVAIAPASIQSQDLMSDYAKQQADRDIMDLPLLEQGWSAYVGENGVTRTNPLVSGSLLSFTANWPKTLILAGNGDLLIDASRELKKRLAALGRPVELVEYDERPHGWWTLPHIFAEDIRDSAERIAQFVLQ